MCLCSVWCLLACRFLFFFFFNDTATTEIYTLSLHDALPICQGASDVRPQPMGRARDEGGAACEVAHDRGELPAMTAPRNHLRRSYRNTSSATSTRPNGALTCTPCTARFTC